MFRRQPERLTAKPPPKVCAKVLMIVPPVPTVKRMGRFFFLVFYKRVTTGGYRRTGELITSIGGRLRASARRGRSPPGGWRCEGAGDEGARTEASQTPTAPRCLYLQLSVRSFTDRVTPTSMS